MGASRRATAAAVVSAVLAFVAAALALPAGGAQGPYPPLEVNATQFEQGATITVSGRDCHGNVTPEGYIVDLVPPGRNQGMAFTTHSQRAADGSWTASRGLGQGLPAGAYEVFARCWETAQGVAYPRVSIVVLPAPSPTINASLTVTPTTVRPGDRVTASGTGFYGSLGTVGFFLYPMREHLGTVFSDQAGGGRASVSFTVPAGLAPGAYQVIAQNATGGLLTAAGSFTVTSAASPPPTAPAPTPTTPPPTPTTVPETTSTTVQASTSTSVPATSTTTLATRDDAEDELSVAPTASTGGDADGGSAGPPTGAVLLAAAVVVAGGFGVTHLLRRRAGRGPATPTG